MPTQDWPGGQEYVLSNGAALGYRQVPTDAVPDPPVQPLSSPQPGGLMGRVVAAAHDLFWRRRYSMSPTGDGQASF